METNAFKEYIDDLPLEALIYLSREIIKKRKEIDPDGKKAKEFYRVETLFSNNHDEEKRRKRKEYVKKYNKSERGKQVNKKKSKKYYAKGDYSDGRIASLMKMKVSECPKEVIEAKRAQIKLLREL